VSQAPHLHPEFGWFCPSLSLRRKARIALITLVFSVVVGVAALKPARGPGTDGTSTVAPGDAARSVAATVQTNGLAAPAERLGASAVGNSTCEEDSRRVVAGNCNAGAMRRVQARSANEAPAIAALPLGRSTPLEPAPLAGDATDTADSVIPAPAAADPQVPTPPPKKPRSRSHAHDSDRDFMRGRNRRDERWTAYAWPDDRYLRDRYSRSWSRGSW